MKKTLLGRAAAVLAAVLFCLMLMPPAFAQGGTAAYSSGTRRTVRVGLPDAETAKNGQTSHRIAFEKDYLQAVAEYADWDFVYVSDTWANCLQKVGSGELDVLLYVSKTEDRLPYLDYSSESMGTEMCYLYGKADTTLHYDDFAAFDGMTVGFEKGSIMIDSLRTYGEQNGFSFQQKEYETAADMFAALDAGEVDTAVTSSYFDAPSGHVLLSKCAPSPVYIVTSKADPTLKATLDSAMATLFSFNPGFNSELYEYHFGTTTQSAGYSQEELDYLAGSPVVNVYYETDWAPFEYDDNGTAEGITPDIIRAISADTGITFRFVLSSSTQDLYTAIGGEPADSVMAVSYDYVWANDHDLLVTQPYVSGSTMRVTRAGDGMVSSVATVADGYLENQIETKFPDLTVLSYPNFAACMRAVARGDADCTYLNYYQANYYRSMSTYASLSYQPDEAITQGIALGVTRTSNPVLFGILSKSLQHISTNTVQGILSENATRMEPFSLSLLVRRYPVPTAMGVGGLGILIGLLAVLLITSANRQRQNVRLEAAKQEAEEANRAKSDFLSRMSHDMRTPLNGIIGMTYLTSCMDLPAGAQENLKKIDTSSRFLLSLINDLLDMTKAERGRIELHPQPEPPAEFEQYLAAVILPLCESRRQHFTSDIRIPAGFVPCLDKLRIHQVVFNLLSNAVKYTPEGGSIRYQALGTMREDGRMHLHLEVEDNGIGTSESFLKVLFDPFTQENRSDISESRGTGLGLAITKQLVERMGGTIAVKSAPGRGSLFTVDLDADAAPAPAPKPAAPAAEQAALLPAADESAALSLLQGRRVLLCEDHPLNQEIARALLAAKGMAVEIAEDGQRGVQAFALSAPGYYDLILMDIRMPVMNGYEAARHIRGMNRPDARTVPILAMTADAFAEDVRKCTEAGMDGHIAKPVEPEVLYRTILKVLADRA